MNSYNDAPPKSRISLAGKLYPGSPAPRTRSRLERVRPTHQTIQVHARGTHVCAHDNEREELAAMLLGTANESDARWL